LRVCDLVFAGTPLLKKRAEAMGAKRTVVIPNGADMHIVEEVRKKGKESLRREFDIASSTKVVLFVGGLYKTKNINLLIRAFQIVQRVVQDTLLLIVGDGPERSPLVALDRNLGLSSKSLFVGKVSYDEVLEYMTASDVLVLPSKIEGNPRVIIESLASGVPIVGSDVRGINNLIINGYNGLLVNVNSLNAVECLSNAIIRILNDGELAKDLSQNGKKYAIRFDKDIILSKTWQVIQEFLKSNE